MLKHRAGTTITLAAVLTLCAAPATSLALPVGLSPLQAAATSPTRVLGTVTSVGNRTLTVQPASGNAVTVTVVSSTRIMRLEPGQKTLSAAKPIRLTDISVGDRALISATAADNNSLAADLIVAMKQSDIAARQRAEQQDWQRNGVGGIVKSVDAAGKTIVLASGARNITIQTSPATRVRKYSSNSVAFKDTQPSSLSAIKPGDQLRAKGRHSPDNRTVTANAIVFGDFQNIAGRVVSVDSSAKRLTVNDLATKKPITFVIGPDSTLRQLPPRVAELVATRLHAVKEANRAAGEKSGAGAQTRHNRLAHQKTAAMGPQPGEGHAFNRVLDRATPIQLSDLHKGDVVMVVASTGTNGNPGTALTLLSGVAPMLHASRKASQSMFSSSWSLGGGQSAAASGGGQQSDSTPQQK